MAKKLYTQTCLLQIQIGDRVKVISDGREGTLIKFAICPNGMADEQLIALLSVQMDDGRKLNATSDKFAPVVGFLYEEHYPSLM